MELTGHTEDILPAVATGIQFDLGLVFVGMVLPFWAVIGGLIGLLITFAANPVLYHFGVLERWHPGMGTVDTVFANNFDFYMSFGIGLGLAIAFIGVYSVARSFIKDRSGVQKGGLKDLFHSNPNRGDISIWISLSIYVASTLAYVAVCTWLVPNFPWIFFLAYGFIYHAGGVVYHRPHGGHRRPVCQPAHGARGQFHRRGQVFRLPGHRNLVRAHSYP